MEVQQIAQVFAQIDRELWIVTAASEGRRGGLVATFVSQASIAPRQPRVCVGIARQHATWELIQQSGAFALHLLATDQVEWAWRFGLQSSRQADKFAGLEIKAGTTGCPLLSFAHSWLECRVEAGWDSGDRTVFLGEVLDGGVNRTGSPFTFRQLLAQATPEQRQELRSQLEQDAALDDAAIRAWRIQARKTQS